MSVSKEASIFNVLSSDRVPEGCIIPLNFKNIKQVHILANKEISFTKHGGMLKGTIFSQKEVARFDQYLHKYVNKSYNFMEDIFYSDYERYKLVIDAFSKANDDEHNWYCTGGSTFLYVLANYFVISGELKKAKELLWGFYEAAYDYYFVYPNAIPTLLLLTDVYPKRFIKTINMIMTLNSSSQDREMSYSYDIVKIKSIKVLKTLNNWEEKLNWVFIQGNKFVVPTIGKLRTTFYHSWHKNIKVNDFDKKHLDMDEEEYEESFYIVGCDNYEPRFDEILKKEISNPGLTLFKL